MKKTLFSNGVVVRIHDLCHTHVSHKWLYHLDACAGSVLTPHEFTTNVQKRLGNRTWTGFGQCRLCGSFLDLQPEHGETCSTAEATRRKHACVRAVLGGLKLADPHITTGIRRTHNAAAARGDAAQAAFDCKLSNHRQEIPDLRNPRHSRSSPCMDSRWATAHRRHSNLAVCSGHRVQPHRPTNVCKITSTQMETRNSDGPPPSESSDDASSPAEPFTASRVAPRWSMRHSSQSLGRAHLLKNISLFFLRTIRRDQYRNNVSQSGWLFDCVFPHVHYIRADTRT